MTGFYRRSVLIFGLVAIALGIGFLVQTTRQGGGTVGYLFGALFIALGTARLYLLRKS